MKTFLLVKISLIPAIVFWTLLGYGHPEQAVDYGAALGLVFVLWNWRNGRSRPMETALFFYMAAASLALHLGVLPPQKAQDFLAGGSFVTQGLVGFATCALKKPWTAVYAAADYAAMRASPAFFVINMALSLLWSGVFFGLALGAFLHLGTFWSLFQTIFGALVSIFLPKIMVSHMLAKMIAAREKWRWTQPEFLSDAKRDPQHFDVVVIGAGVGGLTAAALLAQDGLKVCVVEQHVVVGGFCHSWLRKIRVDGVSRLFRFDAGVHDFSGVHQGGTLSEILARLGANIDFTRLRQAGVFGGERRALPDDWRDYVALLAQEFPDSAEGLKALFSDMKTIHDSMMSTGEGRCGVPLAPATPDAMMDFARKHPVAVRWMTQPFAAFVESYVADPRAQKPLYALAGYITDRPESMSVADMAPIFGYYFHGGFYPKGGSGVISEALAQAVLDHGGVIRLKTPVQSILVEDHAACGVRLQSGETIFARAVISNADVKRTLLGLLPEGVLPEKFVQHINQAEPSASAFMTHLALDSAGAALLSSLPPVAHVEKDGLRVGLVSPSLIDSSAAPEGFATLELITLAPYSEAKNWFADIEAIDDQDLRRSERYEAAKKAFGDQMIAAAQTLLPGLADHVVLRVDASPLTFARYDWSSAGAIYGLAKKDRLSGLKSPLRGLWLAGAGNMGPGVQAVMIVGARVAEALRPGLLARPNPPRGLTPN